MFYFFLDLSGCQSRVYNNFLKVFFATIWLDWPKKDQQIKQI